jgi:UDP-N-acetylglucosamine 1-carboxyvinyltransferase
MPIAIPLFGSRGCNSMPHFVIFGGAALRGAVRASGAKNAALPAMAAAILADGPVRLENVPRLTDVRTQAQLLRSLGMRVMAERGRNSGADIPVCQNSGTQAQQSADKNVCPTWLFETDCPTLLFETVDASPVRAAEGLVRRMRAGFCVLGPLLARRGRAIVPMPGGCNIGIRPVDLHLKGLAALGADIRLEHGYVVAAARRLTGATIDLAGPAGPTVTGTANVMSAAVLACGTTTIRGAAVEPEIVDLGQFLIALGARIEGLGTSTIRIEGVEQLGGASHRLIPDRIEAATLLIAVAITRGSATICGVMPEHLAAVLAKLDAAGAEVDVGPDWVSISAARPLRAVEIVAEPYPGIPTDLQAQWTALAAVSEGVSRIEDRVFPARFLHAAELNRLGADIVVGQGRTSWGGSSTATPTKPDASARAHQPDASARATDREVLACASRWYEDANSPRSTVPQGSATVTGVARLSGARVAACDLRASAALVLAGLAAEGHTIIDHIHHLDRGYQRLDDKLRQLGAKIERVNDRAPSSGLSDGYLHLRRT